MPSLPEIVASLDVKSPRVVDDIDRVLVHLLEYRDFAARIHGVSSIAPVMLRGSANAAPDARPKSEAPSESRHGDMSIAILVHLYRSDPRSPYHQIRAKTRENYESLIRRILKDAGAAKIAELKKEDLERLYELWKDGAKVAMAHSLVTMLRSIVHFGATTIEDAECLRLSVVLHRMKFENTKPRANGERITVEQVLAIRAQAHKDGLPSIARAQALQYEGKLAQTDVIGQWAPHVESAEVSDVLDGDLKWVRGIRWNQIDESFVLRHVTSARGEKVKIPLKACEMVMEEFRKIAQCRPHDSLTRDMLPVSGPIIVNEETGRPYLTHTFRRRWREIARAAGVPDHVENRDSRMAKGKRSSWQREKEKQSAL
jgi:hypothetical protein